MGQKTFSVQSQAVLPELNLLEDNKDEADATEGQQLHQNKTSGKEETRLGKA